MPLAENAVYFFHFVALCLVWPYLPLFLSRYVSEAELGLLLHRRDRFDGRRS